MQYFILFLTLSFFLSKQKVEWDTKAGTSEVQRIATSLNINTNEIQSITTILDDIDEVQFVKASAISRGEVQTITISPPPGETSLKSFYSFSLRLNMTSSGGSISYSRQIPAITDAFTLKSILQEILTIPYVTLDVSQESQTTPNHEGCTYAVTFPASMKNVPQLEVYLSDVPVFISTLEDANLLKGSFQIEFKGEVTHPIPVTAEPEQVQSALQELESIGEVLVTRSALDDQDGSTWRIQFISDLNGGNIEDLIIHSENVYTTNKVGGASVELIMGGINGSYIDGSFVVVFGKFRFLF
jgi:hypothetical protein